MFCLILVNVLLVKSTLTKLLQPWNTPGEILLVPILVTEVGILMLIKLAQFANTLLVILTTLQLPTPLIDTLDSKVVFDKSNELLAPDTVAVLVVPIRL